MDKKSKKEKLEMWKKQEAELREQLDATMKLKGKAAAEGDLSENAAYKGFIEDAEMISARLGGIQKFIKELEKELN